MGGREVTPNLALLALVLALATAAGATPYLVFIDMAWLIPACAIGGVLVAVVGGRNLTTRATLAPTAGEWLTAFWASVGYATLTSFSLLYYGVVYGFVRLVITCLGWFDVGIDVWWASRIALVVSVVFALALYAAYLGMSLKIPARLYPRLAGVRSSYYAIWVRYSGRILLAIAFGLLLLYGIAAHHLHKWYWYAAAVIALFYSGSALGGLGEKREKRRKDGLSAVQALFGASGWEVSALKTTGDPELDPLTEEIDLIARRDGDVFAVEVIAADVDWTAASGLQTSVRVLAEVRRETEPDLGLVRPLLVLVGENLHDSVRRFAEIEEFDFVHLPQEQVQRVLKAKEDEAALAELARTLIPETAEARSG